VLKSGHSGSLAFVTVGYSFYQHGELCLDEEQDIVYRELGPPVPTPQPIKLPPVPAGAWSRLVAPDTRLLFRFSALTFNAHRIHYDRPYTLREGATQWVAQPPQNVACRCRDRNATRAELGGGFPSPLFRYARWVHSSTIPHVSASPPTIPDGRISRVRF